MQPSLHLRCSPPGLPSIACFWVALSAPPSHAMQGPLREARTHAREVSKQLAGLGWASLGATREAWA